MRLKAGVFVSAVLMLFACKQDINPHVTVEADAQVIIEASAKQIAAQKPVQPSTQIVLTLNNAPGVDQPFEQDLLQREVAMFEQKNPGIRIQYSPWIFSPESFFERARNHTLTDIVEVWASQMGPIMTNSLAADITDNVANAPEIANLNSDVMKLVSRDNRVYGVPVELHTLALFYNRRIFDPIMNPKPVSDEKGDEKSSKDKKDKTGDKPARSRKGEKKSKGADSSPRDYLEDEQQSSIAGAQLAQGYGRQGYYQQGAAYSQQPPTQPDEQASGYNQRGEQTVNEYNNPRRQQRSRGSYYDYGGYYSQPQQGDYPQQYMEQPRRVKPAPRLDTEGEPTSARDKRTQRSMDEDIVTTDVEEMTTESVEQQELVTTMVRTANLPQDWDSFVKAAVKLTDHDAGVFGYAPILFAQEGGREFSQWCVQAGLDIEGMHGNTVTLDVNTSTAGEVAQFVKDLVWRYDVTPPAEKCYTDNLLKMFAEGKVAMITLPATGETIQRLIKLGMPLEDIGIAALPQGPVNRSHLTFGRCLIINSQLDRDRRMAAFKWLLFKTDPECAKIREQFYFREQEMTGLPCVPLYTSGKQQDLYDALKLCRTLPVYADYESIVAAHLDPEPPYLRDKLYEAVAAGVRPIIEQADSNPMTAIGKVGSEFQTRYLNSANDTGGGIQRYIKMLTQSR